MTTIEAAVWVLGLWSGASVVLAAVWVAAFGFRDGQWDKEIRRSPAPLDLTGWRSGRGFTIVEAMIVVAIAGIVLVIVAGNVARCGDGKTEMQRCAEQCGEYARPALLPSGFYGGVTCSCLPPGTQAVPYPLENRR